MSSDIADQLLSRDVAALGGKVTRFKSAYEWSYFPHVKAKALSEGFYEKLKALQGKRATYYVGGLMNFETVESTASFAKYLVETMF